MDHSHYADLAHDDIVDTMFALGWAPIDPKLAQALFGHIHSIISRRIGQALEGQLTHCHVEMRRLIEGERCRMRRWLEPSDS